MTLLLNVLLVVQILAALVMIGLILIQHGKGADMGAAFGGGSSGSLFGASGSANFLSRSTAVLATVFFVSTLFLSYVGYRPSVSTTGSSILESVAPGASIPVESAPASTVPAAPAKGAGAIPEN